MRRHPRPVGPRRRRGAPRHREPRREGCRRPGRCRHVGGGARRRGGEGGRGAGPGRVRAARAARRRDRERPRPARARSSRIVRRVRPEVVVCPDPTALYFGDGWVNHRDHRVCGFAVLDAVAPAAASPLYFPDAGPPHQVRAVYLTGTLEPDTAVAITDVLAVKAAALACHQSQLGALAEGQGELVHELVEQRAMEAGPGPRRPPRRALPRPAPGRLTVWRPACAGPGERGLHGTCSLPLAHGPQHEHGDDGGAGGRADGADGGAEGLPELGVGLDGDERPADHPADEARRARWRRTPSARARGDGRADSGRCPGSATTSIVCSARCASWSSCPPSTRRRTSPTCCTTCGRPCPTPASSSSTTTAPTAPPTSPR